VRSIKQDIGGLAMMGALVLENEYRLYRLPNMRDMAPVDDTHAAHLWTQPKSKAVQKRRAKNRAARRQRKANRRKA
jgi:hypothetical protein